MEKFNLACLIDDDPIYLMMTEAMINKAEITRDLLIYRNGQLALDNLKPKLEAGVGIPEIIFLDLNMPVLDGWQFLDEFILIPSPKKINIFIMTSSIDPEDINKAKTYNEVNSFLQKPPSISMFQEILNMLKE
jgi:CheY-like chemotaxis protein